MEMQTVTEEQRVDAYYDGRQAGFLNEREHDWTHPQLIADFWQGYRHARGEQAADASTELWDGGVA